MAITWRDFWGEHGAWAIVLSCYAGGLIISIPPSLAGLLLLPSVILLTGGKGIAKKAGRTGKGLVLLTLVGFFGILAAVPAALAAPIPFLLIAIMTLPFLVMYFFSAGSVAVIRSLAVELYGAVLLSSVTMLTIASSGAHDTKEALLAWLMFALLFMPGVVRAKLMKNRSMGLRITTAALAIAGSALIVTYIAEGAVLVWAVAGILVYVEDLVWIVRLPSWPTMKLGIVLTVKNAAACLLFAFCWKGF